VGGRITGEGSGWAEASRGADRKPQLEQGLERGPETLGYATSLWTSARVAQLTETACGVRYHPGQ
jgi:hypothetical protein